VTILAYAVGEKSFVDANGNNIYDSGETFYDLGDLYIDWNENGAWDTGEQDYAPYASAGSSACRTQPGATALPSYYDDVPSKTNTCDGAWGRNYVRRDAVIVLSGSYGELTPSSVSMGTSCLQNFSLTLTDVNGNAMPSGTTIATGSNYVEYIPFGETATTKAAVSIIAGSPVPSTNSSTGTTIWLSVEADCGGGVPVQYPQGWLYVVVTSPKGNITSIPITVTP
jgi:hypothetical protein